MKELLKQRFLEIYPENCRLLCIELNGFVHRVFYDTGEGTKVVMEESSSDILEAFNFNNVAQLFWGIPHHEYQGLLKKIVYVSLDNTQEVYYGS